MANKNSRTTITTVNDSGSNVAVATINATGNDEENFSQPVAGSSTNIPYALTLDPAKVAFLRVDCDVTCTVKLNSSSAPTDTWNITGGTLKIFPLAALASFPFTAAITANIYVTVPGATGGTLTIYAIKTL